MTTTKDQILRLWSHWCYPNLTGSRRNPQYTVENNLIIGTGPYVPDNMCEAQTMQFQVMSVLTTCRILGNAFSWTDRYLLISTRSFPKSECCRFLNQDLSSLTRKGGFANRHYYTRVWPQSSSFKIKRHEICNVLNNPLILSCIMVVPYLKSVKMYLILNWEIWSLNETSNLIVDAIRQAWHRL